MIRWALGLFLTLSLLAFLPRCNLLDGWGGNAPPPLPLPPAGPRLPVALLLPTTGEQTPFGRALRDGAISAFDTWNSHGRVLGRQIEWTIYDTGCDFESARRATEHAVADGSQFIIGPLCSEAAIAAAEVAAANNVLLLAPTATHPLVTVDAQGQTRLTVFRVSYAYPFQSQVMARFAFETLRARQAAILSDPGDDYSTALAEAFSKEWLVLGGQVGFRATYTPTDPDFIASLQAAGAEVLYLPAPASVVNRVAGQLASSQASSSSRLTLLGSDSWEASELDLAGTAGSYFTTHFFLDDGRSQTQQWAEVYKASYAVAPNTLATLGHDAADLLMQAIQQTGSLDVKAVAETLAGGRFEAVTGPISFDHQHNPIKPVPVVQVKDGSITFIEYIDVNSD